MARVWTEEQQSAIDARGGSILVSAAAGSGKTSVLVERVLRLITDERNPVPADRLIIVTYTNAAAAELKQRLGNALSERIEENPNSPLLQEQQILLQAASIGTIHSFCFNLIRQNFHALKVSAGFAVADDTALKTLAERAMEQTFERWYNERAQEMDALLDFFCGQNDEPLRAIIDRIHTFSCAIPFAEEWLSKQLESYENPPPLMESHWARDILAQGAGILRNALAIADEMGGMLEPLCADKAGAKAQETVREDQLLLTRLRAALTQGDWDGICALREEVAFGRFMTAKLPLDAGAVERLKAMRERVKDLTGDFFALFICSEAEYGEDMRTLSPILKSLFELTQAYAKSLAAIKQEGNVLDFSDALQYALQLLAERRGGQIVQSPLAKEIADYYAHIIIDEFQDVTTVADEIFRLLSKEERNIFIVGDIKQSIYRFNQANPDLFTGKKNRAASYREQSLAPLAKIFLTHNFRSRCEVTDFVNFLFTKLMSEQAGEVDYNEEECLRAAAAYPPATQRETELCIIDRKRMDANAEEEEPEDAVTLEARLVASKIRAMVDGGYPVSDGAGGMRPCNYRDFCVLMRAPGKRAGIYLEQLKLRGIDGAASDSNGYFSSREVMVMLSLLRVIDNPLRDIALASVMLSPMFGFSATELAQIRVGDRKSPLYIAAAANTESEKCARMIQTLQALREYAANYGVLRLIRKIYDSTDFLAVMQALDSGEQKGANLRLLMEYAQGYERAGSGGLSGFLRYIDRAIERGEDGRQASVISSADNVVRIMSIHKSKGLEFPVCFVCGCASPFNLMDLRADFLLHYDMGVGVKIRERRKLKKYATVAYQAIQATMERNSISEEMRLLYVAATRAKEKLIFTMTEKNLAAKLQKAALSLSDGGVLSPYAALGARSFSDWLLMCMLGHADGACLRELAGAGGIVPVPDTAPVCVRIIESVEQVEEQPCERVFTAQPDEEDVAAILESLAFAYPFEQLTALPAKLTVTELAKEGTSQSLLLRRPDFTAREGLTGAQRGDATHKFMQYADYAAAKENPQQELARLCEQGYLTKEQCKGVYIDRIAGFFTSDLGRRIFGAQRVWREHKFMARIPAAEYDGTLARSVRDAQITIQGIADCIFEEGGELVLIDYKTDYVTNEQTLAALYARQLALYRRALRDIFGQNVKQAYLYSFSLGKEILLDDQ